MSSQISIYYRDTDMEHLQKVRAMIVKFLFYLGKSYPFPDYFACDTINEEMFDRVNTELMSHIIYYLLNVINPDRCVLLVPHPLTCNPFIKGVMKFLNETFKDLPHMKFEGLRLSTLAPLSGQRFEELLAYLVTNTVHMVYEKLVASIPRPLEIDENDRLRRMVAIRNRTIHALSRQRQRSLKAANDISRLEEALLKLKKQNEHLKTIHNEGMLSCPTRYAALLGNGDTEQDVQVLEDWENNINKSFHELSRCHNVTQGVRAINLPEINLLERDNLLNSENKAIICKIAGDHNIQLFDGSALSFPGFLRCVSIISEKMNILIMEFEFKGPNSAQLQEYLDTASNLLSNAKDSNNSIKAEVEAYKINCRKVKTIYDELVAKGEIVHKYSYSHPIPNVDLNLQPPQECPPLPMSPGDSWKEELENVKRNCRVARPDASVNATPNLTRKKNNNTSANNDPRNLILKQAGISWSRGGANSLLGESFQDPLSSSSPKGSSDGANARVQLWRSIADEISVIDAEMNAWLGDNSGISESRDMYQDATFGDSPFRSPRNMKPETNQTIDSVENAAAQSKIPNPPSQRELPRPVIRSSRPSIEAICKRYRDLREKISE